MRRFLPVSRRAVFSLLALFAALPGVSETVKIDGIIWRYHMLGSGSVSVDGTDVTAERDKRNLSGALNIPSVISEYKVLEISSSAFSGYTNILSVTIPSSVTNVGASAFSGCGKLTQVDLNGAELAIGNSAFANCGKLKTLREYGNVRGVGASAFSSTALAGDVVFEKVISISDSAFQSCSSLKSVRFRRRVISLGSKAFYNCTGMTNLCFDATVGSLGSQSFYGCTSLGGVHFGGIVSSVGEKAFASCSKLRDLEFAELIGSIGSYAFQNCTFLTNFDVAVEIESIGSYAFKGCSALRQVSFASKVGAIGEGAFKQVTSLLSARFSDKIDAIGASAFSGCTQLGVIGFGGAVGTIGGSAFSGCIGLRESSFGSTIDAIGASAFSGCTNMSELVFGHSVGSIGDSAFSGCSAIETVNCHASVGSVGESAFSGCDGLQEVRFSGDVGSLGDDAFCECPLLTTVAFASEVGSIGEFCFGECEALSSLTFGGAVDAIGGYAFYDCVKLKEAILASGLVELGEAAFQYCESLKTVILPGTLVNIPMSAFEGCSSLQELYFAEGIEAIEPRAFLGCGKLCDFTLPSSLGELGYRAFYQTAHWNEWDVESRGSAVVKDGWLLGFKGEISGVLDLSDVECRRYSEGALEDLACTQIIFPGDIVLAAGLCADCRDLQRVVFAGGIETIPARCFEGCASLSEVIGADGIKEIGEYAFAGCAALDRFQFGDALKAIGGHAFEFCALTEVTVPSDQTEIGVRAFYGNPVESVDVPLNMGFSEVFSDFFDTLRELVLRGSVGKIGDYEFAGCEVLSNVVIKAAAESFGSYAFLGCTALRSVTFSDSIKKVMDGCFSGCSSLESIRFGCGVTTYGSGIFSGCSSLTDITMPPCCNLAVVFGDRHTEIEAINISPGTTKIAEFAFSNFLALSSIEISSEVVSMGDNAFYGCTNLFTVTAPTIRRLSEMFPDTYHASCFSFTIAPGTTEICDYAFYNCVHMSKMEIPFTVTKIGSYAFAECTGLTGMFTVPERVTEIGEHAFAGCSGLSTILFLGDCPKVGTDVFKKCRSGFRALHLSSTCGVSGWPTGETWKLSDTESCLLGQYANTSIKVFRITFDSRNIGGSVETKIYLENRPFSDVALPECSVNAPMGGKYRVLGWYDSTDPLTGHRLDVSNDVATATMTYYSWRGNPYMAQVEDVCYTNLLEAFSAAEPGQVVRYLGEVTNTESIVISGDAWLDLGGKTLQSLNQGFLFTVGDASRLVISNGTITVPRGNGGVLRVVAGGESELASATLSKVTNALAAVVIENSAAVKLVDSTVTCGSLELSPSAGTAIEFVGDESALDITSGSTVHGYLVSVAGLTESIQITGGRFNRDPSAMLHRFYKAELDEDEEYYEVVASGLAGVERGDQIVKALESWNFADENAAAVLMDYPARIYNQFCAWALNGAETDAEIDAAKAEVESSRNVIRAFVADDRSLLSVDQSEVALSVVSLSAAEDAGVYRIGVRLNAAGSGANIVTELLPEVISVSGAATPDGVFSEDAVEASVIYGADGVAELKVAPSSADGRTGSFFYKAVMK